MQKKGVKSKPKATTAKKKTATKKKTTKAAKTTKSVKATKPVKTTKKVTTAKPVSYSSNYNTKKTFFDKFKDNLKRSFNISPEALTKTTLFDFLFYFFTVMMAYILASFINIRYRMLPYMDMQRDITDTAKVQIFTDALNGLLSVILSSVVFYVLFLVFIIAIFQGAIWCKLMGRQYSLHHIKKYLQLSIIWVPAWFVLILLFSQIFKESYARLIFFIALFLFVHLTNIVFILFTKENLVKHAITKGMGIGFTKIGSFIIPYIVMGLIYFVVFINFLFRIIKLIPSSMAVGVISGILSIMFMVWARKYILVIVDDIMDYKE